MLLASEWSEPARIAFAPDLSGNDPNSGSCRFLGHWPEERRFQKQKEGDFLYSKTWPESMQYRALILDHSRLGNCFRRRHRSYKCHLWRHLAVHIRRRMSAEIYPRRDKTGDYVLPLHQFPPVGTSISAQVWPVQQSIVSLTAVFVSSRNA